MSYSSSSLVIRPCVCKWKRILLIKRRVCADYAEYCTVVRLGRILDLDSTAGTCTRRHPVSGPRERDNHLARSK
jgi:hypothetical protein